MGCRLLEWGQHQNRSQYQNRFRSYSKKGKSLLKKQQDLGRLGHNQDHNQGTPVRLQARLQACRRMEAELTLFGLTEKDWDYMIAATEGAANDTQVKPPPA